MKSCFKSELLVHSLALLLLFDSTRVHAFLTSGCRAPTRQSSGLLAFLDNIASSIPVDVNINIDIVLLRSMN